MHQLDLVAAVVEQRREPAADAEVELHPRVLRVLRVHVVALLVGDHLERQLVVVAQEEAPLAVVGDRGRLLEDLDDRRRLLAPQRHEHARHHREVERHVALVAVAEVRRRRPPATGSPRRAARGPGSARRSRRGRASGTRASRAGSRSSCRRARTGRGRRRGGSRRCPRSSQKRSTFEHRLLHLGVVEVEVGLVRRRSGASSTAPATGSHVQFEGSVSTKMIRASW